MRIGTISLATPLILAPMAGVTDKPFRSLCRRLGAGYAVSEMVGSDPQLWATKKSKLRMDHQGELAPVGVQIAGSDPQALARAAAHNVALGAQIIDINMGCPAKKVCKALAGSALLRDEALVARILSAVVAAVSVPVTLKMRTGYSRDRVNGVQIARIAEQCGIQALAVHGRTRDMHSIGRAEHETAAAIKRAVRIPVIVNGDIDSPDEALSVLGQTGADAIMIGRAAQGRPWIFGQVAHYLETGVRLPEPGPLRVKTVVLEHTADLHAFYGEVTGVRVARKHLAWYAKARPGAERFRAAVNRSESATEQLQIAADYFDRLAGSESRRTPAADRLATA